MYITDMCMSKIDRWHRSPFYTTVASGFEVCGSSWSWEYKDQCKDDGFMIWLVHGGRAWLQWDQGSIEVSRGDCILMPIRRESFYIGGHDQNQPLYVFWAILEPSETGISQDLLCRRAFRRTVEITRMLEALCDRVARHQGTERDLYGSVLLLEIDKAEKGSTDDLKKQVLQSIKEHGYSVGVGRIARELGYSYDQLIRKFSDQLGCTPKQFITEQRMNRARELVRYTPLQIKQIAYELGYTDQFSFTKQFTKSTGESPSRYRNRR